MDEVDLIAEKYNILKPNYEGINLKNL